MLVLGWVIQGIWENAVCERWLSVYGGYPICWGLANSDVQKIYLVVRFWFCCKLHVWVEHTEVILYVFKVSVAGIIIIKMSVT